MKKIISVILLITIIMPSLVFAEGENSCKYTAEIEECKKANGLYGSPGTKNAKKIKEFQCIYTDTTNVDYMIYQIILDKKFKEVDEKVVQYITSLDAMKRQSSNAEGMLDLTNDVLKRFKVGGDFWSMYYDVCSSNGENSAFKETGACLDNKYSSGSTDFMRSVIDEDPMDDSDSPCILLAKTKLEIYSGVAFNILKLNKGQVRRDNRGEWRKTHRERYELLFDLINITLRYLDSIARKWPSKTKHTKQ